MKVTITTLTDQIFTLEVSDDMELENFKAFCEVECNIPATQIALFFDGRPLSDDKRKLKDYNIRDGDVLLVQRIQGSRGQGTQAAPPSRTAGSSGGGAIDFGAIQVPGMGAGPSTSQPAAAQREMPEDPATLRDMLLASPHDLAILKERNPPLADALLSGSLEKFSQVLRSQQQERAEKERQRIRLLSANPFDADAQKLIAEEIRLKNVESNMETAMEFAPESFGQVHMLYIDCCVNGHPVKAFVDSGAQMTIMSQACAERCNIMRLVDTRWAGIAKGVGTQKIIGRVHLCQIQIGPDYLQSSFSILEDQPMDMLLGLDMLKRHQCCLDLKKNVLVIGTTGTSTSFLAESDLPQHARLNHTADNTQDEDRQLAEALAKSAEDTSGASQPRSPKPSSQSSPAAQHNLPESDIQRLASQGFPRQQVIEELQKAGGNVDQALASLIAKSLHVP